MTDTACRKSHEHHTPVRGAAATKGANPVLPADESWASGKVKGVQLRIATRLLVTEPKEGSTPTNKASAKASHTTQDMWITAGRGRVLFTADDVIPKDTELRYKTTEDPDGRYLLLDPAKKLYWQLGGAEVARIQEGGPESQRTDYRLRVEPHQQRRQELGYTATLTTINLTFEVGTKALSAKRERVRTLVEVWHTEDARLDPAWGDTLVSLLSLPFGDEQGQKVIKTMQRALGFPLRWTVTVRPQARSGTTGQGPVTVQTTAVAIGVAELARKLFRWPPQGFKPATQPYQLGRDGQTVAPEVLSRIPPLPPPVGSIDTKQGR